jgi:hypothetical protein
MMDNELKLDATFLEKNPIAGRNIKGYYFAHVIKHSMIPLLN